jgi:hypothetical protein
LDDGFAMGLARAAPRVVWLPWALGILDVGKDIVGMNIIRTWNEYN